MAENQNINASRHAFSIHRNPSSVQPGRRKTRVLRGESVAAWPAGLFGGFGGLEIREALRQRRVVLVDGVQCESVAGRSVSRVRSSNNVASSSGKIGGLIILRLARSREESLLAGVADDAHGSGVLCADSRSDRPPWQHQSRDCGRDVRPSTAKRPSARPSCRSGRASAQPWLPGRWQMAVSIQCHSNGRAPQICNLDISVAGEAGTRRRWGENKGLQGNSKGREQSQGNSRGPTLPPPIVYVGPWFLSFSRLVPGYSTCNGRRLPTLLRLFFLCFSASG